MGAGHRDEDRRRREERDPGRQERDPAAVLEVPRVGGEEQGDDRGDRRLEHHRPRDVAHRQRVLALADPDHGVELLGQLGRDRGDDEREQRLVEAERRRQVLDGADEEVRTEDDERKGGDDLEVDHPEPGRVRVLGEPAAIEPAEPERGEVLGVGRGIGLEVGLHVPRVDPDQDDRHDPLQLHRLERQERGADRDRVGDHEVPDVVGEHDRVDRHHVAGRPLLRLVEDRDAGHEHRQRREHERRAEDRAHADAVRRLGAAAGQDRDDRDHRLRQRRADGGEDGPDGPLGQLELPPEPLDAVREELRAQQDDHERDGEDQDVHRAARTPRGPGRCSARSRRGSARPRSTSSARRG